MKLKFPAAGFNRLTQCRYGPMLYNQNDKYIGKSLALYGEFSEYEIAAFRQICRPGQTVVEVGANIGTHTLAIAEMLGEQGRVIAFEPQQIVFQCLCANLALNSLTQVEAYPFAVGDENKDLHIAAIDYHHPGNFGGFSPMKYEGEIKVQQYRLDDFLELNALHFLKIDVEGMEQKVLAGATKLVEQFRPVIYLENDRQELSPALIRYLWQFKYRCFWHQPPLFNPSNYNQVSENIFPQMVSTNLLCFPAEAQLNMEGLDEVTDADAHPMKVEKDTEND